MRSLLEVEEKEASEITLSTASLLGIFFGLVLICGVFFGLGYSLGRGSERGAIAGGSGSAPAINDAEPVETTTAENAKSASLTPLEQQDGMQSPVTAALMSAASRPKAEAVEPPEASTPDAPKVDAPKPDAPKPDAPAAPAPALRPAANLPTIAAPAPRSAANPSTTAATDTDAAASNSKEPMVQIAAVARQEDADVLVSALRQRGYGVVVRSEPQDKLLHVQVGPFADRTAATAIKQKLLSDGYNAIIKQ
jgi:cell division septation protein DedD